MTNTKTALIGRTKYSCPVCGTRHEILLPHVWPPTCNGAGTHKTTVMQPLEEKQ